MDALEGYCDGISGKPAQSRPANSPAERHEQDAYIAGHVMGLADMPNERDTWADGMGDGDA